MVSADDAFEVHYTATVRDRIAALTWFTDAFRPVKPRQPFRTPLPFYATPFFVSFLIACPVPILSGLLLKALMPDVPAAEFLTYYVVFCLGLVVGGVLTLPGLVVQRHSTQWRSRLIEGVLMRANGGALGGDVPETATLSAAGLRFENPDRAWSYPWSQLSLFAEQRDRFAFAFRSGDVASIPKDSLDDAQCGAVRRCVERHAPRAPQAPVTKEAGPDRPETKDKNA